MTEPDAPAKRRPMSPRRKLYIVSIISATLIGAILGGWLAIDESVNDASNVASSLTGNSPLSHNFAVGASILWITGMALCMTIYHRAVDDHEERAWLWACVAGWYAVMFVTPVWWVLHRASLAPPADAMTIFTGSLAVNCIVWLWLKYR